eukprot:GHUV01024104.1.p1 GENE.GHUV01024104.1~~GHUV01024104.1.p1  ORF type:complete len:535 (+),score=144.39 GHUV01024104.1:216-1820(+)
MIQSVHSTCIHTDLGPSSAACSLLQHMLVHCSGNIPSGPDHSAYSVFVPYCCMHVIRGPVSYDEDGSGMGERPQRGGGYNRGGYGRGGSSRGGGRGGRGEGQERWQEENRILNDSIQNASSWRELQAILEQNSRTGMLGLDGFQLVSMLSRLVKVPRPTEGDDAADYQQFVASVYGWMMDRMPRCRSRQISGAIFAIGRLNLYNAELVGALLERAQTNISEFGADEYVKFLDGLQRMNVAPTAEWTAEFFRTSADKIVQTARRDEVTAIVSFVGRLGMQPTPEWLATITAAAIDRVAQRDTLQVAEYRRLLVGLASLGWRPNPQQLQMIVDKSYPLLQLPTTQVHDLVEIAWSLAQWETPMPQQWTQVFCDRMTRQRRFIRPGQLGSLLYSLAYLRAPPRPDQIDYLLQDLRIQFDDATCDDLANVAMALVQFQFTPRDSYMDDFLITIKMKLSTCSATGLQNLQSALPAMGSGVRLNEVVREAVSRYEALMAQQQVGGEAAVDAADQQQYEAQQYEAVAAAEAEQQAEQQPVA